MKWSGEGGGGGGGGTSIGGGRRMESKWASLAGRVPDCKEVLKEETGEMMVGEVVVVCGCTAEMLAWGVGS